MTLTTRFTDAYGVAVPIVGASASLVAMPELCAAICAAGGFGAIAPALAPPGDFIATVEQARDLGARAFHVNIITPICDDAYIDAFVACAPPAVSFHWDPPPRAWIDRLHAAGIKVWAQLNSADVAKKAVDDGVDLIIAQGLEAGGHTRDGLTTLALVPDIIDAVAPTLVLAAGGIADGRGLAAVLALGADGAFIGTRFVASAEGHAAQSYKDRLVAARAHDTILTSAYGPDWPSFNPNRVLRNALTDEWHHRVADLPGDLADEPVIGRMEVCGREIVLKRFMSYPLARGAEADLDLAPLHAGQGVGRIHAIEPVSKIIADMVEEAERRLRAVSRGIDVAGLE